MSVLAEAVERAVGRVLAEANGRVEALVSAELDRQVAQIAATVIADRNSSQGVTNSKSSMRMEESKSSVRTEDPKSSIRMDESKSSIRMEDSPAAKTCRSCGLEKPADQYERGRRTCRQCRRAQERARAGRTTSEADRPGADAQHD